VTHDANEHDRQPTPEPSQEPDFAEEHTSPTLADEEPGGGEDEPEEESPHGYAGMD
jgi:hypothetical protein